VSITDAAQRAYQKANERCAALGWPELSTCPCYGGGEWQCVCCPTERILRAYIDGTFTTPMTAEQREWCLGEIEHCDEGSKRADYEQLTDNDVADATLHAWAVYVKDMY
jgi:hypothetical protein